MLSGREEPIDGNGSTDIELGNLSGATTLFEDDFTLVEQPQTTKLQNVLQVAYSFAINAIPVGVISLNSLPLPKEFFAHQVTYEQVTTSALMLGAIISADAIRHLCSTAQPFSNWDKITPIKYALAIVPPLAANFGVGLMSEKMAAYLIENHIEIVKLMINPLSRSIEIGLISYSLYGLTKKLIECAQNKAHASNVLGAANQWWQKFLKGLTDPLETIAIYFAMRDVLVFYGWDKLLHNDYFTFAMTGIIFEQLRAANFLIRTPEPRKALCADEQKPAEETESFLARSQSQHNVTPSTSRVVRRIGFNVLRSTLAVCTLGYATLRVARALDKNQDPEKRSTLDNFSDFYIFLGVANIAEPVLDKGAGLFWNGASRLSGYASSLFKTKKPDLEAQQSLLDEDEMLEMRRVSGR